MPIGFLYSLNFSDFTNFFGPLVLALKKPLKRSLALLIGKYRNFRPYCLNFKYCHFDQREKLKGLVFDF